jgi:hypothetical protein
MSWLRLMEEKFEENESVSAAKEAEANQTPLPHKKHTLTGLIKDMWPAYLIEIIVIILGISITLGLEAWRENNREGQLEKIYLDNLLSDVNVDLNSLNWVSLRTEKLLNRGNELLGFIRNPEEKNISFSRINAGILAIIDRPKFIASDATFSDLKSSGNLHLIKDIQLKNLIFGYYSETQHIKEIQDAEQMATITLSGPFFLKHFPLGDSTVLPVMTGSENISTLLKNIEFDNQVLLRVSNRRELMEIYHRTDSIALLLKNELIKQTGHPEN